MSGTATGLKRALRPLRPVLGPPWRLLRRSLDRNRAVSAWTIAERLRVQGGAIAARLARRPRPPIRALHRHELLSLAERLPYYRGRVAYMSVAGREVNGLIARHQATTALELGPHVRPLVVGADVMELEARSEREFEGREIVHDATQVPWPITDRAYDIFVGLQVFEHLQGRQADAFAEVRRVARHAVLSLPIDWVMPDPTNIHHQLSEDRALSWFAPVRPSRTVVGNPGPRKRIVYVFENLPAPGPYGA